MAENRLDSCCRRAVARARLRDHDPTNADIAWLLGITSRWVSELQRRGVLPVGAPLPVLVKRMAAYRPEAKLARQRGGAARRSANKSGA